MSYARLDDYDFEYDIPFFRFGGVQEILVSKKGTACKELAGLPCGRILAKSGIDQALKAWIDSAYVLLRH